MAKPQKLLAEPVSKILSLDTAQLVGWVYRWNNGEVQEAWLYGRQRRVCYEPLARERMDKELVVSFLPEARRQETVASLG